MIENKVFYKDGTVEGMTLENKRAILFGAGEYGSKLPVIEERDLVIALDGGLAYCLENGIEPDYIIGDFDSLPKEKQSFLVRYPSDRVLRLPTEKDDTDMFYAINFAKEKGIRQFVIYGGMGGRLSHTIANIQCLVGLKREGMHGILVGKSGNAFVVEKETCVFDKRERGYVSVFSYSPVATGVTIKNMKYELSNAELTNTFALGVSNEFIGKSAEISVKQGILLVITEV